MTTPKVLVVATSHKTRGGITSVVKAHQKGEQWKTFHCKWIETHIDKGAFFKLAYFIRSFTQYLFVLPFYDIVHIHLSEPPSALRKSIFVLWAKILNKKVIAHFHAFSPETTIDSKFRKVYGFIFSKADCVIVLSEYWQKALDTTFQLGDKVKVIYNPCTSEVTASEYKKKKQILYAGTVNARKGYSDLIKAFAEIAMKHPDWKIVFAGNGEVEQGKKLAQELNIAPQTEFLGWINGDAKDKAFKESMIFCLPSYAEGFPMAVLDAWAYGLPVITTPVGGIPDIAKDGKNLLLFNPGDIHALAMQMDRLISNEKLRWVLSEESFKLSTTTFNIETINEEVENIYKSLISISQTISL